LAIVTALVVGWLTLPGPSSKIETVSAIVSILLCVTAEDLFGHERFRRIAWLGGLTYSTYLIHFPIMLTLVIVTDRLGLSREIFAQPLPWLIYLVSVLALGHIVYRRFEVPAQRLIRTRFMAPGRSDVERAAVSLEH